MTLVDYVLPLSNREGSVTIKFTDEEIDILAGRNTTDVKTVTTRLAALLEGANL